MFVFDVSRPETLWLLEPYIEDAKVTNPPMFEMGIYGGRGGGGDDGGDQNRKSVQAECRQDVYPLVYSIAIVHRAPSHGPWQTHGPCFYLSQACAVRSDRTREMVLVANKIDLRFGPAEEEPLLEVAVSPEEASLFVEKHGLSDYREVSARTGANVKLTFSRSLAHAAFRAPTAQGNTSVLRGGGLRGGGGANTCAC